MNYGRDYNAEELRKFCGSPDQISRIASYSLREGREKDVHCLDFRLGSGLNFTVVPDRCMDIAWADYKGFNLAWASGTGIVHPSYYQRDGWGFSHSFFGGLLTTCGLVNVGAPDQLFGEPMGAHGRISNVPATHVSHDKVWTGRELYMLARGQMRECWPNHYDLVLRRRIQAMAGEKAIKIHDTVTNEGARTVPHQILYHINPGFPLLAPGARLLTASSLVRPRDAQSEDGKRDYGRFQTPTPGYKEKIYYHEILPCSDGRAWVAIINNSLGDGLGLYVKYDPEKLPVLMQWKMMGEGTYVLGIEPSNSYGHSMEKMERDGTLPSLKPGEEVDYHLEIGILDGPEEIDEFEREVSIMAPVDVTFAPPMM